MANLCEALGYARNETAKLTRISNANLRHERGGTPYVMGSPMARDIEKKLSLDPGWMDTPPETDTWPLPQLDRAKILALSPEMLMKLQELVLMSAKVLELDIMSDAGLKQMGGSG